MNKLFFLLLIFSIMMLVQSCSTKTVMRQDSLIGKIINTNSGNTVEFNSLIKEISNYDVIYLSEKHNNSEHHKFQQRVIHSLIENKKNPSVGFEFFSMNNTPYLLNFIDSAKKNHPKKIERMIEIDLREKLGWDSQSDTMWKYYFDLLTTAKNNNLKIAGIDLSETLKKRIIRKGINKLSPLEKDMIFATQSPATAYQAYMYSIFKSVHCGMANEKMQSKLYDIWIARNDKMALSITQLVKHSDGPVIIIVGGGHTEYGLGVISQVKAIDKNIRQVNIAMQEISVNPSNLLEYLKPLELEGTEPVPPADFIWFAQRVSYEDPCKEFEDILKKMGGHKKPSKKL